MAAGRHVISLVLQDPPQGLFDGDHGRADEIVIELTDDPQIAVELRVKRPGPDLEVIGAALTLDVERASNAHGLSSYERLLHDVLAGDQLLFTRADEIERLWEVVADVLDNPSDVQPYTRGSWGPDAAIGLAEPFGWRLPDADG